MAAGSGVGPEEMPACSVRQQALPGKFISALLFIFFPFV